MLKKQCVTVLVSVISPNTAVSEPDPSQEEEGSGHSCTFKSSPGRNFVLANRNHWLQMTSWNDFSPGFPCCQRPGTADCCAVLCFTDYLRWAMSRSAMNVCVVLPPIA